MIVKMNKYAFLVYHKEYDAFLTRLRDLGVVHVAHTKPTKDHPVIQRLEAEKKRVQSQLDFFDSILKADEEKRKKEAKGEINADFAKSALQKTFSRKENEELLDKVEALREDLAKSNSALASMSKECDAFSVWGDFSYDNIQKLHKAGYEVTFFTCQEARFDESWETDYNAIVVEKRQSACYFITVTPVGATVPIDADRAKLPSKDFVHISDDIAKESKHKEDIENSLLEIARTDYDSLKSLKREVEGESEWNTVLAQTEHEADDKLMLLEGWAPDDKSVDMETNLAKDGYYFQKLEITDEDVIPIKLKNNKFARLFEPITNLYSLPNYKELDQTPLFAPFFMLFFGLCFGDGGYGILMFIVATIFKRKVSDSVKPLLTLAQVFGVMTLVIGTLTGTFFGVSLIDVAYFSSIKKYFLSSDNLMIISLVIGFVHVIFAKFVAALNIKRQRGFKYSLSSFAWIFVIISLACIFALPMFNINLSHTVINLLYGIAIVCGLVVFFYNTPGKNIFLNFGSGIWNTYNVVSGLVGDVLSYIRLYAIGLTSSLLGGVFNTMAIDMTSSMNPFVRWLPMLLILLVGHAINISLGLISSIVHPLRLVYVEYFKNAGFEGGGNEYKPFGKISNNE